MKLLLGQHLQQSVVEIVVHGGRATDYYLGDILALFHHGFNSVCIEFGEEDWDVWDGLTRGNSNVEVEDVHVVLFGQLVCLGDDLQTVQEFGFGDGKVEDKLEFFRESVASFSLYFLAVYCEEYFVHKVQQRQHPCPSAKSHEGAFTDLQSSAKWAFYFGLIASIAIEQILAEPSNLIHLDDKTQVGSDFLFENCSRGGLVLQSFDHAFGECSERGRHAKSQGVESGCKRDIERAQQKVLSEVQNVGFSRQVISIAFEVIELDTVRQQLVFPQSPCCRHIVSIPHLGYHQPTQRCIQIINIVMIQQPLGEHSVAIGIHLRALQPICPMNIPTDLLPDHLLNDKCPSRVNQIRNIVDLVLVHHVLDVGVLPHDFIFIHPFAHHFYQSFVFRQIVVRLFARDLQNLALFPVPPVQNQEFEGEEAHIVNHNECQLRSPCVMVDPPSKEDLHLAQYVEEVPTVNVESLPLKHRDRTCCLAFYPHFSHEPHNLNSKKHSKKHHPQDKMCLCRCSHFPETIIEQVVAVEYDDNDDGEDGQEVEESEGRVYHQILCPALPVLHNEQEGVSDDQPDDREHYSMHLLPVLLVAEPVRALVADHVNY